jgi:hypothetical protein
MKDKKLALAIIVAGITVSGFGSLTAHASSHREAPAITEKPKVDSTDFYIFNSYETGRSGYVTLLANYIPLQDPQGGPNYFSMDPDAAYDINIDSDGDAKEDITFRFRFKNRLVNRGKGIQVPVGTGDNQKVISIPLKNVAGISAGDNSNLGFNETYTLDVIRGGSRNRNRTRVTNPNGGNEFIKPYDNIGDKTFTSKSGYAAYAAQYMYEVTLPNCANTAHIFVGQRKESFAVNLGETFDLVNYVPIENSAFPGGIIQDPANDDLRNKNITTIAMEVPAECITGSGNGVVGGWTSSSLRQVRILNPRATFRYPDINGGAFTQVSRLGAPLVNELVIGLKDKDRFNSSQPRNDGQFADYITHPSLPFLLNVLFKDPVNATLGTNIPDLAPSNIPRQDLVTTFLTGVPGVNQLATVTPSEMIRLNTATPPVASDQQNTMGVIGGDIAGFPNGRRPGDDVVDIALRVIMGNLCHLNLGVCVPADAPVGNVPFTDGAPISAADFDDSFPYLKTPIAGSPN